MFKLLALLALALAMPVAAQAEAPAAQPLSISPSLEQEIRAVLDAAPPGTRFGLLVTRSDGSVVVALDPDKRFIPASNTKLFTTAAALARMPSVDQPDRAAGTGVGLERRRRGPPDVVLVGRGDARMSSAPDCVTDCLATLADAIAAQTRRVGDIVGDATLFPDQRWSPGMSWNNIGTDSGTAISALSLDDNELPIVITPTEPGKPPRIAASPYLTLRNDAVTVATGKRELRFELTVNGRAGRVYGQIPMGEAYRERLGIDDPALYAAWTLQQMLAARGVRVSGKPISRYRTPGIIDEPALRSSVAPVAMGGPQSDYLAVLVPAPLLEDVTLINKVSQNLHAELLARRIGLLAGTGSLADWSVAIGTLLETANVPRTGFDFSDGSGMSTYNRVSPRATVGLLRWALGQPWGETLRASLPVGGGDGTLRRRFTGTPLQGNIRAKTGTLNATNALGGYLRTASGQELVFAIYANDVPEGHSALAAMDAALLLIAARN